MAAVAGGTAAVVAAVRGGAGEGGDARPAVSVTEPSRPLDTRTVGKPLWTAPINEPLTQVVGGGATVVAVSNSGLSAVDRATGTSRWTLSSPSDQQIAHLGGSPVAVRGSTAYATRRDRTWLHRELTAVDLATGRVSWRVDLAAEQITLRSAWVPGVLDDMVLVTAVGFPNGLPDPLGEVHQVVAVDAAKGRVRWRKTFPETVQGQARLSVPSSGKHLLWTRGRHDGSERTLTGLDATAKGAKRWEQPAPGARQSLTSDVRPGMSHWSDGPHCSAGGRFLHLADRLYAVEARNGQVAWRSPGSYTFHAVVVSEDGDTVYAASSDAASRTLVFAFDAADGTVRWAGWLPGGAVGAKALHRDQGTVYLWDAGTLWALDAKDGQARWRYELVGSGKTFGAPVPFWAAGGQVYGVDDKGLVAFRADGTKG